MTRRFSVSARWVLPTIVVGMFLWLYLEIQVLSRVASTIGLLGTIVIVIAATALGFALAANEGRKTWAKLGAGLSTRQPLSESLVDGALILFGALLLVIPGFISGALGLLLIVPLTRALVRPYVVRVVRKRGMQPSSHSGIVEGYVVGESDTTEPDPPVITAEVVD